MIKFFFCFFLRVKIFVYYWQWRGAHTVVAPYDYASIMSVWCISQTLLFKSGILRCISKLRVALTKITDQIKVQCEYSLEGVFLILNVTKLLTFIVIDIFIPCFTCWQVCWIFFLLTKTLLSYFHWMYEILWKQPVLLIRRYLFVFLHAFRSPNFTFTNHRHTSTY